MNNHEAVTENDVKNANKEFYDAVAATYETIDGRRSADLEKWITDNLKGIAEITKGGYLLDIGTGSGIITRCAKGIFNERIGLDISSEIVKSNKANFDYGIVAEADKLPFADYSFDVVTCFAVLHHLYSYEKLMDEISRVLRPGGVLYCDHDMDAAFYNRFQLLLKVYRRFHDAKKKYHRASQRITKRIYELSEWHETGVDSHLIAQLLTQNGFSVTLKYHWFGLNSIFNLIFNRKQFRCGWAPLILIKAIKIKICV